MRHNPPQQRDRLQPPPEVNTLLFARTLEGFGALGEDLVFAELGLDVDVDAVVEVITCGVRGEGEVAEFELGSLLHGEGRKEVSGEEILGSGGKSLRDGRKQRRWLVYRSRLVPACARRSSQLLTGRDRNTRVITQLRKAGSD